MPGVLFKRHEHLSAGDWRRLSDLAQEFEAAWRQSFGPDINKFIPAPDDPLRIRSLIELVRIDQEFRWQRDERRLLESYLEQWPELKQSADVLVELLEAECLTRASFDAPADDAELQARFPELAARVNLAEVAAVAQAEKAQASTDQVALSATQLHAPADAIPKADAEDWSIVRSSRRLGKLTGKKLGRYELRRVLGNGGMGTVYEAWDTELMRAVALKMPRPELLNDPTVLQRFMTEARSAAAIRHPNVCPIYDVGQIDGQYFLTMPLIDGVSLAAWLEKHVTNSAEAVPIIRKLASALQAVHDLGTRHRDIKASNVMIDRRGEPILMDFGLARLNDSATQVTDTGSMLGTPAYMAPEQIEHGASAGDHRADIYSLGVLFYQMLTGRLPFVGPVTRVLVQIATQDPPAIEALVPDVDPAIAALCRNAMSRDPAARFQTATDLETALGNWLEHESHLDAVTRHPARQGGSRASALPDEEKTSTSRSHADARQSSAEAREPLRQAQWRDVSSSRRRLIVFIATAFVFALAAAIVIRISDRAELVIKSTEPGLEVKVLQLSQPEQERTLTIGENSVRVRSGQVEVVLTGANADQYEVVGEKITLKRFGREVVEIKRRPVGQPFQADSPRTANAKVGLERPTYESTRSLWDDLDPAQIPEAERVPRQPEGLVAVLGQHRRRVGSVTYDASVSSDGAQFTLTTEDGLYLFGRDPKQTAQFFDLGERYTSATFLPDGRIAAFVASDPHKNGGTQLQIFAKPRDGAPLEKQMETTVNGYGEPIASSDGQWLAAYESQSFGLWKLGDAPPQRAASFALPSPDGGLSSCNFSPDAHWFCFTERSNDQSAVHLIDLRGDTPREATVLKADADEKSDAPAKGFEHAVFLSDGRLATADRNGRTWFWDINDGEPQRRSSIRDSGLMAAAAQSLRLAVHNASLNFRVWDLAADPPKLLGSSASSFQFDHIQTLAIAPNGETVFTGHFNGAVRFWNVSEAGVTELDPLLANPNLYYFHQHPKVIVVDRFLCSSLESSRVGIWRPTRDGLQPVPEVSPASCVLNFSRAQRQLIVQESVNGGGTALFRCDADRVTPTRRITADNVGSVALNDEGRRLAIGRSNGTEEVLELWGWESDDLPASKLSEVKSPKDQFTQLAFAEAGRALVERRYGGRIQIWDVKDDQLIPRTPLTPNFYLQFAVAPDGQTLATTSNASKVELWNLKSDLTKPTTSFAINGSHAVAFSPDGRRLAASFWENGASAGVQIINLASGVVEKRLTFPGRVHEVTFTDDSRHLITGNANATIYVVRLQGPPTK